MILKEEIEKYGFKESSKKYYIKDAPGYLPYWIEVILDIRFGLDDVVIKGKRNEEEDTLFRGKIDNLSELEIILKSTKSI